MEFATTAEQIAAIEAAKLAVKAAEAAHKASPDAVTLSNVTDAKDALFEVKAGTVAPAAPVAPVAPSKAQMYLGVTNADAASKHNSWGGGLPRGEYSDAKTPSGRVRTFGYLVDGDGELILSTDGHPTPKQRKAPLDGKEATGRFIVNHQTNAIYKLYLSQENGLTVEQRATLTDTEAQAIVFNRTEMELNVVSKDGRNEFSFVL